MTTVIDKAVLKEALRELIIEDSETFKKYLKEALNEFRNDDDEFEILIKQNFKRFDATFKALA
jgi:hypothetical protein